MANELTGDFDVVAEFSLPAANRVLAAMHRAQRMLHTISLRVADNPPPGHHVNDASLVAVADRFGDASVDHNRIPTHPTQPPVSGGGSSGSTSPMLDSIVNLDVAGVHVEPLVPSRLQGRAQVQLSPPTIHVPDSSGKNVTLKMELRARYLPDPQTPRVAEFVRGDLEITAPVDRVASQDPVLRVVEIDIKGVAVICNFTRKWSSTPISAEDLAGVNQLIRNSLRNSFLPSSEALPAGIEQVQFKTLRGARDALAVLLNMEGGPGNPASQTNVFLGTADDFAIGAGADYVRKEFQPTIDSIRNQQIPRIPVLNISYEIQNVDPNDHSSQLSVDFALENGRIMLTIRGKAHTPHWWAPDFVFTVRQPLTLVPNGATAELVVGDLELTTDDIVADRFKGPIRRRIVKLRDRSLADSGAADLVRDALNADDKFGGLIASLLRPTKPGPGWLPPDYVLRYTSIDIRPSGIVLHGSLAVRNWPVPHVEFERVPSSGGGTHVDTNAVFDEPQYSALKTWIPGGTIDGYEWSTEGQTYGFTDANRFIYEQPGPGVSPATEPSSPSVPPTPVVSDGSPSTHAIPGYVPLCLTVRGTRLSSSGAVTPQPVSASVCGYSSFPIVGGFDLATAGFIPMVALTQPGPEGMVEVTGHTAAATAGTGAPAPNVLVHFVGEGSFDTLGILTAALGDSGRQDAATAVLAVVGKERLSHMPHTAGVVYAEQDGGAWERVFDLKEVQRPVTLIVGPNREVLWKQEGSVDRRTVAEALRKSLVRAAPVRVGMLRSGVRIGHAPPNFLFEYAPGRSLTLRKLAGRPATLVFWKSSSQPSIEAVRELQHELVRDKAAKEMVLAINDGDTAEAAQKTAAGNSLSATVVSDPDRKISSAYGVNIWPTIVSIGASGLVSGVSYGRTDAHRGESAKPQHAE